MRRDIEGSSPFLGEERPVTESAFLGDAITVKAGQESQVGRRPLGAVKKKPILPVPELFRRLREGDRGALSRGITLIESTHPLHRLQAAELLDLALQYSGRSVRVGITGIPGVGKSSLIEALGLHVVDSLGKRLAVLTVDPSSVTSHGSILGDKSRMARLSVHPSAFIRPSPSGGCLGGVAHQTRETIQLCEAAGCNVVFVETVGVGQSETSVHAMVDCFLLLTLAGAGDELQGIKRGIMEMADVIALTKSDGENLIRTRLAQGQLVRALMMYPPDGDGERPEVLLSSAVNGSGIVELWEALQRFLNRAQSAGRFLERRQKQSVAWMHDLVRRALLDAWFEREDVLGLKESLEAQVRLGGLTPRKAAQLLLESRAS